MGIVYNRKEKRRKIWYSQKSSFNDNKNEFLASAVKIIRATKTNQIILCRIEYVVLFSIL